MSASSRLAQHVERINAMCTEPDSGPLMGAIDHLARGHGYTFGPNDDPAGIPHAVAELHRNLHSFGSRHRGDSS